MGVRQKVIEAFTGDLPDWAEQALVEQSHRLQELAGRHGAIMGELGNGLTQVEKLANLSLAASGELVDVEGDSFDPMVDGFVSWAQSAQTVDGNVARFDSSIPVHSEDRPIPDRILEALSTNLMGTHPEVRQYAVDRATAIIKLGGSIAGERKAHSVSLSLTDKLVLAAGNLAGRAAGLTTVERDDASAEGSIRGFYIASEAMNADL